MSEVNAQITQAAAQSVVPAEKEARKYARTPARSVVLIYWQDAAKLPCEATAIVRDVSAGGFGLRTDRPFDVGKSITVRTPQRSLECAVRHVQEEPHSYLVGLQILSASDGSSLEQSLTSLSDALASIGRK